MLFNSYVFIFFFLPATLLIFSIIVRFGSQTAVSIWLIAASLFFYSWWNPLYLTLLVLSVLFNFGIGTIINKTFDRPTYHKMALIVGITCNISLLGYYKYAGFLVNIINEMSGAHFNLGKIFLPLAISFFTLQQISYLVDAYRGKTTKFNFLSYAASVTFFPHLIAGPIVRYRDLVPQFSRSSPQAVLSLDLAVGLTLFFLGLFKKVILADHLAKYVGPAFAAAAAGRPVTFLEAWVAGMAFIIQIYFDFSAYSDMAIGLGRIFGIRLPVNFNSPLKAVNFMDFWRRWHITLSDFVRDYIYFPLGGSRKGVGRQYLNIMIIFFLVGLWHGAGWTYIIWGSVHGLFIVINHFWHRLRRYWGHNLENPTWYGTALAIALTFTTLSATMALFRADNLNAALIMLKGMAGLHGVVLPSFLLEGWGLQSLIPVLTGWGFKVGGLALLKGYAFEWLTFYFFIIFFMPNTQEIMSRFEPCLDYHLKETEGTWKWLRWRPTVAWAGLTGVLALAALLLMGKPNPFLYFQF
jgi:D-alanyl-lipoteichoic acid acyltransferase DltB (MBOAT superfamily)